MVVFAIALRARLHEGSGALAGSVALGLSGLGFIAAGSFSTQPLFGYPPGTPDGMATDVTPMSVLHVFGAFLLFFGLTVSALVLARRQRRAGATRWASTSLAAGLLVLGFFGASGSGPSGQLLFPEISGLLQRIWLSAGLGWVAALALREIGSARGVRTPPGVAG
jgi:Protein of unknown function (DUF998)